MHYQPTIKTAIVSGALALSLMAGCTSPAPSPTTAPTSPPAAVPSPAPTTAPAAQASVVPYPAPSKAPAASATTAPYPAPGTTPATASASTPTPYPYPAPSGAAATPSSTSIAELAAKSRSLTEYSFESKITRGAQSTSSRTSVKGNRVRQEVTNADGTQTVTLLDYGAQTAYVVLPAQPKVTKTDFALASSQVGQIPVGWMAAAPAESRFLGNETVDGKPAAVFQTSPPPQGTKYWVWIERGLPLRIETNPPSGVVVMEFTNYLIGPLEERVFELPAGVPVK